MRYSLPLGSISATRPPPATPRDSSALATRLIVASSSPHVIRLTNAAPYSTTASLSGCAAAWNITMRCGPGRSLPAARTNSMNLAGRTGWNIPVERTTLVRKRARSNRLRSVSSTPRPYTVELSGGSARRAQRGPEQPLHLGELRRRARIARHVEQPGVAGGGVVVQIEIDAALQIERLGQPRDGLAGLL